MQNASKMFGVCAIATKTNKKKLWDVRTILPTLFDYGLHTLDTTCNPLILARGLKLLLNTPLWFFTQLTDNVILHKSTNLPCIPFSARRIVNVRYIVHANPAQKCWLWISFSAQYIVHINVCASTGAVFPVFFLFPVPESQFPVFAVTLLLSIPLHFPQVFVCHLALFSLWTYLVDDVFK